MLKQVKYKVKKPFWLLGDEIYKENPRGGLGASGHNKGSDFVDYHGKYEGIIIKQDVRTLKLLKRRFIKEV